MDGVDGQRAAGASTQAIGWCIRKARSLVWGKRRIHSAVASVAGPSSSFVIGPSAWSASDLLSFIAMNGAAVLISLPAQDLRLALGRTAGGSVYRLAALPVRIRPLGACSGRVTDCPVGRSLPGVVGPARGSSAGYNHRLLGPSQSVFIGHHPPREGSDPRCSRGVDRIPARLQYWPSDHRGGPPGF
jgi:hypothetical protein